MENHSSRSQGGPFLGAEESDVFHKSNSRNSWKCQTLIGCVGKNEETVFPTLAFSQDVQCVHCLLYRSPSQKLDTLGSLEYIWGIGICQDIQSCVMPNSGL